MKNQVIIIKGGEVFSSQEKYYEYLKRYKLNPFEPRRAWRHWLEETLNQNYEVMMPPMPNDKNADYIAWKIWFEKLFPYLNGQKLALVGYSLGATFLVKYLSENKFPGKINQLHLAAAVFDDSFNSEESLGNFLFNPDSLVNLDQQVEEIYLYHSTDDALVPFKQFELYRERLPRANVRIFNDRNHFFQLEFKELLDDVNKLSS